jgi:Carboxypeptidase regulatory-like domain
VNGSCHRPIALYGSIGTTLLLFVAAGQAMATGNISGTLKTAAGTKATVAEARVTATSAANKIFPPQPTPTDDSGAYSLDVDPGTYTLVVVGHGLAPQVEQNVVVKDGDKITKDFTMADAKPFPIVKSPNAIPLTDDINSASFTDAPDINVNSGWNVAENDQSGNLLSDWTGPAQVGGRFRVKYSDQGIHLAADVTFAQPGVDFGGPSTQYLGNAIEFYFQNDPYDPTRTAYDPDHNWQFIIGLGTTPDWWMYGAVQAAPTLNGAAADISKYVLIKDRPNKDGELVRIDLPWGFLLTSDQTTPITPPKDGDLGAFGVALDNSGPDAARDAATRQFQLGSSGYNTGYTDPSVLTPIQLVTQAPATPPAIPGQ